MSACPIEMSNIVAGLDLYGITDYHARRWYADLIRELDARVLETYANDAKTRAKPDARDRKD